MLRTKTRCASCGDGRTTIGDCLNGSSENEWKRTSEMAKSWCLSEATHESLVMIESVTMKRASEWRKSGLVDGCESVSARLHEAESAKTRPSRKHGFLWLVPTWSSSPQSILRPTLVLFLQLHFHTTGLKYIYN